MGHTISNIPEMWKWLKCKLCSWRANNLIAKYLSKGKLYSCIICDDRVSLVSQWVKKSTYNAWFTGDEVSIPGSARSSGGRKWQPTPVSLPGEPHGERSLVGYSPWDHKESDTTKVTEHSHMHVMTRKSIFKLCGSMWMGRELFV